MTSGFMSLRNRVAQLREQLKNAETQLQASVRTCKHDWTEPERDDIVVPGYRDPGDPPGTMGIDWRGPFEVPEKRTKRWKRECRICGDVQHTGDIQKEVVEHPQFYD